MAASKAYEIYSNRDVNFTGGRDPTLENITINSDTNPRWSIMKRGYAIDSTTFTATSADFPVLLFSIEELSTADFKHMPSKEEEQ